MHQTTIPRSSSPQPRQYTDYAIPAARMDSGLNITLHFLFDKLRAAIPVRYCNSELQGVGCEANAIFRSPGDKPTEQRNLSAWARLPAVTMRCADTQGVAEFQYVYRRRIRAATHPLIRTSSWGSYFKYRVNATSTLVITYTNCFKVS
jgi:hypothetical protein